MKNIIGCLLVGYCVSISQIYAHQWHDKIFSEYTITERLQYFTAVVDTLSEGLCEVVSHRNLGVDYASDYSTSLLNIALRCRNGSKYLLSIEDNIEGTFKLLDCEVWESSSEKRCFDDKPEVVKKEFKYRRTGLAGEWSNDQYAGGRVKIYYRVGTPYLYRTFRDGSTTRYKLTETKTIRGLRYDWENDFNEYVVILPNGELGYYDEWGLVMTFSEISGR